MSPSTLPWSSPTPALALEPEDAELLPAGRAAVDPDPGALILTCANCGAPMDERKCKLICRCGYFLSCSDYY
jgi:hypothetical protein